MERGLEHFTEGLAAVFGRMGAALKPGAPLVFTYHHNNPKAYDAVGVALLDAGLVCSATLPCPAEMGGSIHIHGTESSIVDTVFVCRSRGKTLQRWLFQNAEGLAAVVADDIAKLRAAGHKPSLGDLRCIIYGHLTRMAIWKLRDRWQSQRPTRRKHEEFAEVTRKIAGIEEVMNRLDVLPEKVHWQGTLFDRASDSTEVLQDAVPF
jgi:adenine-specific DNA methylase